MTALASTHKELKVEGTIDTPDPASVTIEFFANTLGDPSGYGEGQFFLGMASPDKKGKVEATLPPVPEGTVISATATDPAGNTSEFSADIVAK